MSASDKDGRGTIRAKGLQREGWGLLFDLRKDHLGSIREGLGEKHSRKGNSPCKGEARGSRLVCLGRHQEASEGRSEGGA